MAKNGYIWEDRKRIFGLKLSFTKYMLTKERLFLETGFFNLKEDEILLYRVRDLKMTRSLFQRILRLGTVEVISTDDSLPSLKLENIAKPKAVKELLHQLVESEKGLKGIRVIESVGEGFVDVDNDGIPDVFQGHL